MRTLKLFRWWKLSLKIRMCYVKCESQMTLPRPQKCNIQYNVRKLKGTRSLSATNYHHTWERWPLGYLQGSNTTLTMHKNCLFSLTNHKDSGGGALSPWQKHCKTDFSTAKTPISTAQSGKNCPGALRIYERTRTLTKSREARRRREGVVRERDRTLFIGIASISSWYTQAHVFIPSLVVYSNLTLRFPLSFSRPTKIGWRIQDAYTLWRKAWRHARPTRHARVNALDCQLRVPLSGPRRMAAIMLFLFCCSKMLRRERGERVDRWQ